MITDQPLTAQSRNFVLDTRPPQPLPKPSEENIHTNKRKNRRAPREKASSESKPKNAKRRKTQNRRELSEEDAEAEETPNEDEIDTALDAGAAAVLMAPRRSSRARKLAAGSYREDKEDGDTSDESTVEVSNSISDDTRQSAQVGASALSPQTIGAQSPTVMMMKDETEEAALVDPLSESVTSDVRVEDDTTLNTPQPGPEVVIEVEDDEEPKPKLSLQVKYQGFHIYGRCLCVVVEPWPPIRSASRAPSLAPPSAMMIRAPSIAPSDFIPSGQRAKTPLFLPDFDRETTPTLVSSQQTRILPPVPLFNDPSPEEGYDSDLDADDDNSGLLRFSQTLSATAETNRMVEDDDEFEGAVFFADADQAREL